MQSKNLGIIIPLFNQLEYTKKLFTSLCMQSFQDIICTTIVFVDNCSTDGTHDWLTHLSEDQNLLNFHVISNSENLGFAKAINQGISYLSSTYADVDILLLNNDMELDTNCIEELYNCAYSDDSYGIVGGMLRFPDDTIQHAGAFLNIFGWGMHKNAGQKTSSTLISSDVTAEEYVTGALFYIKSVVIHTVGGLDEIFSPAYFEEVDYCYMAREAGFKSVYCPTACAIHYENTTGKSIYKDAETLKKNLSDTNQIRFYLKRETDTYTPTSEDQILISSKIYGEWSFSSVMRNLAKGLSRSGVDVSIAPEEYHNVLNMEDWEIKEMILKPNNYWDRNVLRSCEGDHMYLMPPGKKRIAHTTGESTRISSYWKEQLNHVDQVLTTSTFFKHVLLESGVTTSVDVLPNSVDTSLYHPNTPKYAISGLRNFNFYSVFHFGDRKNPLALIRAFGEEFGPHEDVTLFVHSLSIEHALHQQGMTISQWISRILHDKPHAPILITSNFLSDALVPRVMSNFDTFVLPTRGEGFGLPVVEASALGIPSIVTGYSGVTDIVNSDTGWLVDYKLSDIPLQYLPYFKNYIGGKWADISIDHLRSTMRYAYEHPEKTKQKGKNALQKAQEFSIENVGKLAKKLIF